MAKKEITPEMLRTAYINYLQQIRKQEPEAFADFTEKELVEFIRRHEDSNFGSIYERTDHNFYDRVRSKIAIDKDMRAEDDAIGQLFSVHLRSYSHFLESKAYKELSKMKINIEGVDKATLKPSVPSSPKSKEREMTEGEKIHVEFEVAHRNQALRQACIDKYGYQCQCCGMNFADMYGEELGNSFIEVHHLKMISTYDESKPNDYVENLVPLCSNCHSMIHHGKNGPLSLRELREAYKGEKKEIKVWKED